MKTTLPLFNPNLLLAFAVDISNVESNYACEIDSVLHLQNRALSFETTHMGSGVPEARARVDGLVRDVLADGRPFRIQTCVDQFSRYCPMLDLSSSETLLRCLAARSFGSGKAAGDYSYPFRR